MHFDDPAQAADALSLALHGGFPTPYCAALAESVLDALTGGTGVA